MVTAVPVLDDRLAGALKDTRGRGDGADGGDALRQGRGGESDGRLPDPGRGPQWPDGHWNPSQPRAAGAFPLCWMEPSGMMSLSSQRIFGAASGLPVPRPSRRRGYNEKWPPSHNGGHLSVGLWLPNYWEEVWRYVMREVGGSVRSDGRPDGASPVGLESELGGDGNETEVRDDATPPIPSGPSGTGVRPEAASGPDFSAEGGLPPQPRLNRYASRGASRSVVVEQMVSLRREDLTVDEIAERAGCHRTTVSKHLKRAGLTLRTDVSDESFRRRVRQVYAETGTIKSTAKRLGVGKRAVRKIMRATQ